MKTNVFETILKNALERRIAVKTAIKAVNDEPEFPDAMPDEMWEAIRNNREYANEAFRIAVRKTKEGIAYRIIGASQEDQP